MFIKLQVQHRYSEFAALHAQLTVSIEFFKMPFTIATQI